MANLNPEVTRGCCEVIRGCSEITRGWEGHSLNIRTISTVHITSLLTTLFVTTPYCSITRDSPSVCTSWYRGQRRSGYNLDHRGQRTLFFRTTYLWRQHALLLETTCAFPGDNMMVSGRHASYIPYFTGDVCSVKRI